jgi:hypothetical protein
MCRHTFLQGNQIWPVSASHKNFLCWHLTTIGGSLPCFSNNNENKKTLFRSNSQPRFMTKTKQCYFATGFYFVRDDTRIIAALAKNGSIVFTVVVCVSSILAFVACLSRHVVYFTLLRVTIEGQGNATRRVAVHASLVGHRSFVASIAAGKER